MPTDETNETSNVIDLQGVRDRRLAEEVGLTFAGRLLNTLTECVDRGLVCPTHIGDHLCCFMAGALLGAGWTVEQIGERMTAEAVRIQESLRATSPAKIQALLDRAKAAEKDPTP